MTKTKALVIENNLGDELPAYVSSKIEETLTIHPPCQGEVFLITLPSNERYWLSVKGITTHVNYPQETIRQAISVSISRNQP